MENRATDRIEKLNARLSKYVKKDIFKLYALTDNLGFKVGNGKKKIYEK